MAEKSTASKADDGRNEGGPDVGGARMSTNGSDVEDGGKPQ